MLRKASQWLVRRLEDVFANYGRFVARYPLIMIICCFVATGLALIGMIRYRTENNAFKLWIPDNSDFVKNFEWLEENSPPDIRFNSLILASEGNILSPAVLLHMVRLHSKVESLRSSPSQLSWEEVCYDIPVISPPAYSEDPVSRSENSSDCDLLSSPWLEPCYPSIWCPIISQLTTTACLEQSLLEIWGYEEEIYLGLTQEDIIAKVNEPNLLSKIFNIPININNYLGEVDRDSEGQIVSAKATNMQWFGKINSSDISEDDITNAGTGEIVDRHSLEWEAALRDLLMEDRDTLPSEVTSYINVARGYSDIAGDTIMGDAFMMPIGFMIMFAYVQIMLGKLSCVQSRAMLALAGLTCIGLSIGFTYGFCSALNLFYGPMHNLIPFLLLGIGVDDMFVIMQCFDNLSPAERSLDDIPSAVSLTMRRAGVAITVTSLTDFMVFVIGATTVLPALRSFCLWCAIGILAVYVFQITLFAGSLALDCRRLLQGRNGFCPCYSHKDVKTEREEGGESFSTRCFRQVAGLVLSLPGRLLVLLLTAGLLGCGVWQVTLLQQEFQSVWFLPASSYLRQWFEANARYFPGDGERVVVYMAEMDWPQDLARVEKLVTDLSEAENIIKSVDSWYPAFKQFSNTNLGSDIPTTALDNLTFNKYLTQFLYNADPSTLGLRFIPNFKFLEEKEVECGVPAPDILLSTFTFSHQKFSGREEHIPALHQVKEIISQCQFSGLVFPFNQEYSNWETDEVITRELFRNLGIALAAVFLTTLILLADLLGSVLVLGTVALSLVDLCGFMHTWDITIDVVSAVNVIIAIGLCVDYSVHICHSFLTVSGSRKERAAAAMVEMGPAVLNGGVSTLIAFILLAGSDSHVFSVFFRIFLLVIIFGLFHGLILLPVVLSFIGPSCYDNAKPAADNTQRPGREKMTIAL